MADDPQFSGVLCLRSNVDLKDEWRNVSVMANGWGSRERARLALKRTQPSHKRGESSIALSTMSQSDEEMADPSPLASSGGSSPTDCPKRAIMRLDILIIEAINKLKEPGGSNKTTIAAYIEMKHKYRIAVTSKFSERRKNPSVSHHEGRQKISRRSDDVSEKSQIDLELAKMRRITPEEAAAKAVAEAEAAMAEAEIAAQEAEAAEADAEAAQAFADAALKMLKERNIPQMDDHEKVIECFL